MARALQRGTLCGTSLLQLDLGVDVEIKLQ